MKTPPEVLEAAANWTRLTRWERAELGRLLRRDGWTYTEIMSVLPVGKGTLSGWCQEIKLTTQQINAIKARSPNQKGVPRDTNWKRREEIAVIRNAARQEAYHLLVNPDWLAGVVLYWAEGCKRRNAFELANTDPRALRLFIRWVRTYLDEDAAFTLQIHLHEGNDESAARLFWQQETGLFEANFHRTFIKPKGTGHRKNHLKHGVCKVRVRRSSNMWNRVMAWKEVVADVLGPAVGTMELGR